MRSSWNLNSSIALRKYIIRPCPQGGSLQSLTCTMSFTFQFLCIHTRYIVLVGGGVYLCTLDNSDALTTNILNQLQQLKRMYQQSSHKLYAQLQHRSSPPPGAMVSACGQAGHQSRGSQSRHSHGCGLGSRIGSCGTKWDVLL